MGIASKYKSKGVRSSDPFPKELIPLNKITFSQSTVSGKMAESGSLEDVINTMENEPKEGYPTQCGKKLNINLLKKFLTHRKSNIKSLLLNQNIISGIGNIYCNEILFKAKILPMRSSNQIKGNDLRKLLFSIKEILTAAIELGGTTIKDHINPNGDIGYFKQKLNVYGRGAELCRFCNEKINIWLNNEN